MTVADSSATLKAPMDPVLKLKISLLAYSSRLGGGSYWPDLLRHPTRPATFNFSDKYVFGNKMFLNLWEIFFN
jgi:hypothetical protein